MKKFVACMKERDNQLWLYVGGAVAALILII